MIQNMNRNNYNFFQNATIWHFFSIVKGVPGFAAAMIRHLHSLRRMQRDHGWIHTLLEEAENERMHLMTFLQVRQIYEFLLCFFNVCSILFSTL